MNRTLAKIRNMMPFGIALVVLLLALWFSVFPQFPFLRYRLEKMHTGNEELAKSINETIAANKLMFTDLAHYRELYAGAMNQPEQTAMVVFRERIEAAATAAGLRSRTIGNIRSVVIERHVLLFDVSFSAEGTLTETVAFLKSVEEGSPRLYWQSIAIQQPGKENLLSLSGTLCALSFIDKIAVPPAPPAAEKPAEAPADKPAEAPKQ